MTCLTMLALTSALVLSAVQAFPSGAPESACLTMAPDHGADPQPPDTGIADLNVEIAGGYITISLEARDTPFRGFFVQVRRARSTEPLGEFQYSLSQMDVMQYRPCPAGDGSSPVQNGLTHVDAREKWVMAAVWRPPPGETGEFTATATVVQENSAGSAVHWVGQETRFFVNETIAKNLRMV